MVGKTTITPRFAAAAAPREASRGKKIFVKVLCIVSGFTALLTALMLLLPQVVLTKDGSLNFFEIFASAMSNDMKPDFGGGVTTVVFFFLAFLLTTVFYIVWMINSLARRRSAGVWGIVTNALMQTISIFWLVALRNALSDSSFHGFVTPVPMLMTTMATDGLALSVLQLIFRDTIRKKPTAEELSVKTRGAKMLFYVCSVFAVLEALTVFIPALSRHYNKFKVLYDDAGNIKHTITLNRLEHFSPAGFIGKAFSGEIEGNAVPVVVMIILSAALLIAWAALCVLRKPFAGFIGLGASVFALVYPFAATAFVKIGIEDAFWLSFLSYIAGIVLASIQIAKRKRI